MSFDKVVDVFCSNGPIFSTCTKCKNILNQQDDRENNILICQYCGHINETKRSMKVSKEVQTEIEPLQGFWEDLKEAYMDDSACSVCLESYSTDSHKVVSLKCGHIFGDTCIKRWFAEFKSEGGPKCPTCKTKARPSDLRYIVAKTLKKVDPEVIAKHVQDVQRARTERLQTEAQLKQLNDEFCKLKEDYELTKQLYEADEQEFARLNAYETERMTAFARNATGIKKYQPLVLTKRMDLEPGCEARVCTVSDMLGVIMISQRKESPLFPPFGLRNIGSADLRPNEFIPLHKAQIKDIAFHPYDAMVLTASFDKTVKLTNIFSSQAVMTFPFDDPAWSCCWNEKDPQYFYVGLRNGKVHELDMRMVGRTVHEIPVYDTTPCCSLKYVYNDLFCGISSTRLRSSEFHYQRHGRYETQILPVTGNHMSSHYERKTANFLLSSRPSINSNISSKPQAFVTHSVINFSLNADIGDKKLLSFRTISSFSGGRRADNVLRGRIFPYPNKENACLVCAGDQDIGGFIVWDTKTLDIVQKIGGITPVFDIAQVNKCNQSQAAGYIALTEKSLLYYNWRLES